MPLAKRERHREAQSLLWARLCHAVSPLPGEPAENGGNIAAGASALDEAAAVGDGLPEPPQGMPWDPAKHGPERFQWRTVHMSSSYPRSRPPHRLYRVARNHSAMCCW